MDLILCHRSLPDEKKKAEPPQGGRARLLTVDWERGTWSSSPGEYARQHQWRFVGRLVLEATDAIAPAHYWDDGGRINAWMAPPSPSGHMLAWLHAVFS